MCASESPLKITPTGMPETLPLFPLSGAVLLPRARLPLNIFEPRYLAMVEHALANGRMIGMVQPSIHDQEESESPAVFAIGGAGRIISFNETDDERYLIVLGGISRFRISRELPKQGLFRTALVSWKEFSSDFTDQSHAALDRKKLLELLQVYFRHQGISVDWDVVQNAPAEGLISTIIMICPLPPNEKQALLEAPDVNARASMLMALLKMATMSVPEGEAAIRH